MSDLATLNANLAEGLPAAFASLSDLGRRAMFPPGIPFQSAQAKGTRYNATIGQVTDGAGSAMPLAALAEPISALDVGMSHLYSPPSGHPALRQAWADRQRRLSGGSTALTTLPFVTLGLTQAITFIAELFAEPGRPVLVPRPRWGNYDEIFEFRCGASLVSYDMFEGRAFSVAPLRRLLRATSGPAVVVLNFPHNPSGYSPNAVQAQEIVQALLSHAGPLVVVVDDAYAGMVHTDDAVRRSLFWDLAEAADPAHHAIFRIDGVTKELLSFSGRVGFLTAALDPAHPAAEALESKLKSLARSSVGSPAGPSQALILHALQQPDLEDQIAAANAELAERFTLLRDALEQVDEGLLELYPCNSGVFSMVRLPDSLNAETMRRRLIVQQSLGLVSEPELNALRIAYCSVSRADLPELVRRLAAGIQDALDDLHG